MPRLPAPEQIYILIRVGLWPVSVVVEPHASRLKLGPRLASEIGDGGVHIGANENLL